MICKRYRFSHLKKNIFAAAAVTCMLATAAATGVSFSRYVTSTSGEDRARVARYVLAVHNKDNNIFSLVLDNLKKPGDEQTIAFTVQNWDERGVCEVSQSYELDYTFTGNLPLQLTLTPDTGSESGILFDGSMDQNGVFRAAEKSTHNYILRIVWPLGETAPKYADEIDQVTIRVNAEQIDSEK